MKPCLALAASAALLVVGVAQAFVPVSTPTPPRSAANTALAARGSGSSPSAGDNDVSRQGFLGGLLSGACVRLRFVVVAGRAFDRVYGLAVGPRPNADLTPH